MTEQPLEIFLSHSNKDVVLAEALIDLLRAALMIPAANIRCTSVDGYRLAGGADSELVIRQEVKESRSFLGLITPSSWESVYVLFELGARWGAELPMIPLLAGIDPNKLVGPLKRVNALNCREEGQVLQAIEELSMQLNRELQPSSSYRAKIVNFVSLVNGQSASPLGLTNTLSTREMKGPFPPFGYFYLASDEDNPLCPKCAQMKPPRIGYLSGPEEWNAGIRRSCRLCNHIIYEKPMDLRSRQAVRFRPI